MGLYFCAFDGENELEGIEVLDDEFDDLLNTVASIQLEEKSEVYRFPTLINYSVVDVEVWPTNVLETLLEELLKVAEKFLSLPPHQIIGTWKEPVFEYRGFQPGSLYESSIDVDGEPLIERLVLLCEKAKDANQSIILQ